MFQKVHYNISTGRFDTLAAVFGSFNTNYTELEAVFKEVTGVDFIAGERFPAANKISKKKPFANAPLSQTPKNSFKRWPSPRNDLVVSNKLFQGPFIPLLWILFGQTGYPIKFFTYK